MSSYTPSPAFEQAANFLRSPKSAKKPSNETMLELYGIYKFLTIGPEPRDSSGKLTSRPSFFSPLERAKWDAWTSAGKLWNDKAREAEGRYIAIAEDLGWPGINASTSPNPVRQPSPTAEELLARDSDDDEKPVSHVGGFGTKVSTMQQEEHVLEENLHDIVLKGDSDALVAFLDNNPKADINAFDEYGFTPLHLSSDRGYISVVRVLLDRGADISIKDGEGLSAADLAKEANQEDVYTLLTGSVG